MAGFTTGAALTIGLTQLRSAFGFALVPPQVGDAETHYQYEVMQWWMKNWDGVDEDGHQYRNFYAVRVGAVMHILAPVYLYRFNDTVSISVLLVAVRFASDFTFP